MKRVLIGAAIFAATISLSSCQKNEELSGNVPSEASLQIQTDITQTRSPISAFADNSELGLFITNGTIRGNYNGVASNANVKSTLSAGKWNLSPAVYLSNADATVFAYHPYKAGDMSPTAIHVEHISQTDYMYGTHTAGQSAINNGNATVNLTMKHALSLVQFKMNKVNYTGAGKLTKIEIFSAPGRGSLSSEGSLNLENGNLSKSTLSTASAIIENSSGLIASIPGTASADESTYPKVLVLPVASIPATGDVTIYFTIDGKVYMWSVPAATVWAQGTKNTYTVTISGTAMVVGNVTIADWTTGTTGTAGLQ